MSFPMPPHVVTTRPDGTHDYWRYDHSAVERGVSGQCAREDALDAGSSRDHDGCEWVCVSSYREGRCGRGAAFNPYGISLCWQHEDALFAHVLNQIRIGKTYKRQLEEIAAAVLEAGGLDEKDALGGTPIERLVRAEIRRYMQEVIDRGYSADYEFGRQLDELVSQRFQQKWGATS
jgi:hypothetical protein